MLAKESLCLPHLRQIDEDGVASVQFVYPQGATVLAQEPAVAILSTGTMAHPYNMAAGRWHVLVAVVLVQYCGHLQAQHCSGRTKFARAAHANVCVKRTGMHLKQK